MKKVIAMLLAISLLVSVFTGCEKTEDTNTSNETSQNEQKQAEKQGNKKEDQKEEKQLEKQKKPFFILQNSVKPGWPQTLEDDIIRQEIQKQSGFEYYIEAYKGADYDTKLQLLLAADEYPDVWYGKAESVAKWKQRGVIMPVGDLMDQYGQDLKNVIREEAIEGFTMDGELWSIPWGADLRFDINEPVTEGLLIRKDWLENVGLEIPETLDDYYEILKAFAFNDPDGNGKDDTYGLTAETSSNLKFDHVFNAFGVNKGQWYERDGQVVIGEMTDEYKEVVMLLRQWYEEGLIDPEFPVHAKAKKVEEKIIAGVAGSFCGHVWYPEAQQTLEIALRKNAPNGDIIMVPALEGPNGVRGYRAPKYVTNSNVISAKCEQPELLMQFLNWWAQGENYQLAAVGIEGTHWKWEDETHTKIVKLGDWGVAKKKFTIGIGNPNRIYRIEDRRGSSQDLRDAINIVNKYVLPNEFEGTVPALSNYEQLSKMLVETSVKIILGQEPIEEFDKMRERWYNEGGKEITDQVNTIWKEKNK